MFTSMIEFTSMIHMHCAPLQWRQTKHMAWYVSRAKVSLSKIKGILSSMGLKSPILSDKKIKLSGICLLLLKRNNAIAT